MEQGTLCFIGEEKYHYTFPDGAESYVRSKIFIPTSDMLKLWQAVYKMPRLLNTFNERQFNIGILSSSDMESAERIFKALNNIPIDSDYFQAELYSAVLQLAVLLTKSSPPQIPLRSDRIQKAIEYINEHISENITIDGICSQLS